jgi:hypothetical protein
MCLLRLAQLRRHCPDAPALTTHKPLTAPLLPPPVPVGSSTPLALPLPSPNATHHKGPRHVEESRTSEESGGRRRAVPLPGVTSPDHQQHLPGTTYEYDPTKPRSWRSPDTIPRDNLAARFTRFLALGLVCQMMAESAPGALERTEWSEVVKLGDQVSRQATVGMSKIDRFHVIVSRA